MDSSPGVGWEVGGVVDGGVLFFEVDGASGAFFSFPLLFHFYGQSALPFTVRGSSCISLGVGVLLREGELSMLCFGLPFLFQFSHCFSLLEWLLRHKGKKYK